MTSIVLPVQKESVLEKLKKWWKKVPPPDPMMTLIILLSIMNGVNYGFFQELKEYTFVETLVYISIGTCLYGIGIGSVIGFTSFFHKKLSLAHGNLTFRDFIAIQMSYVIPCFAGMVVLSRVLPFHILTYILPLFIIFVAMELLERFSPKD